MRAFKRLMEGLEPRYLMARPTGIDVSHWQGTINWASVAANNPDIEFAWTKATEGVDFNDDHFVSYSNGAAANGIPLTGYHFARYDNNPDATLEAQHYLDVVGPYLTEGRMPPMLDVEHAETLTKAQLSAWVNTWCNYVLNATGLRPVIYTGISFSSNNLDASVNQWPLWIANWNGSNPQTGGPSSTTLWPTWTFWQYTDAGTVSGVSGGVDMDVFNGTSAQLDPWLIAGKPASPSPANNANGVNPAGLVLNWGDCAHAQSYDVYVDDVLRANVTASQWTVSPQLAQAVHTWRVVAKNISGSVTGPTWTFTAQVGPPDAPANPTPANNATITAPPGKLDWGDVFGADSYDVYLGTSTTPFHVTASELTVNPADGVRLWRVAANNANGSTSSPQWQYTLDTLNPTASYGGQSPAAGQTIFDFTVTFSDSASGVDATSLGNSDIVVTGPGGYSAAATLQSVDVAGNGSPRTATYRVTAPGGSWNLFDNGSYTVTLNASEVKDVAGHWMAGQTLTSLNVDMPFAYKVGLQLRADFDGTASAITVSNGGPGIISATRGAQTLNFTSVTLIMVTGTAAADALRWAGPISQSMSFTGNGGADALEIVSGTYTLASDALSLNPTGGIALTIAGGASATFNANQHLRALTIGAGASATLAASGNRILRTAGLSLDPAARLDLADNDLIADGVSFTTIQPMVIAGFASSTGITSSTSNGSQILALFDNAYLGASDWNGETIGPDAIVGKYTYFGDANLDGQVTGDDYTVIDANLSTTPLAGLAWLSGDANLDGAVTGDDYTVIDANLGLGAGNPLTPSSLSETTLAQRRRRDWLAG